MLHQLSRVVHENLLPKRRRHRLENLTLIKASFAKHVVVVVLQFGFGGRRQFVLVGVLLQLDHHLVVAQRRAPHALDDFVDVSHRDTQPDASDDGEQRRVDFIEI